jgi:hypothetical protein
MSEDNLKIKGQLDTSSSVSALLPTGIIILKGSMEYSISENTLSDGLCPCDGRAINTYTYRNLHRVISNIYGGTAFSEGLTDVPTATTTFNVPNILNFPSQSTNALIGSTGGSASHAHTPSTTGSIPLGESTYYDHDHNVNINWNGGGDHGYQGVGGGVLTTSGPIPGSAQGKRDGNSPNRIAGVFHGHSSFTRAAGIIGGGGSHGHSSAAYQGGQLNASSHTHNSTISISNTSNGSTIPSYTSLTALIKL